MSWCGKGSKRPCDDSEGGHDVPLVGGGELVSGGPCKVHRGASWLIESFGMTAGRQASPLAGRPELIERYDSKPERR